MTGPPTISAAFIDQVFVAYGIQRIATCNLTLPARSNGSQPYPLYTCLEHARSVPSVRVVSFDHGFTVMMDCSPYFKDVAESS